MLKDWGVLPGDTRPASKTLPVHFDHLQKTGAWKDVTREWAEQLKRFRIQGESEKLEDCKDLGRHGHFNRRLAKSREDVGIWHETYVIKPGHYEAIYSGMPPYGLGKVGKLVAATGKRARSRMATAVQQTAWSIRDQLKDCRI
jgi:hypothetical protein